MKIGHTGTLDPLRQGFGSCFWYMHQAYFLLPEEEKGYRAILKLGQKTQTGDTEGAVIETKDVGDHSKDIYVRFSKHGREQQQVPPQFSALKHKGRPLYSYARKGQHIDVPSGKYMYSLALLSMSADILALIPLFQEARMYDNLESISQKNGTVGHLVGLRNHEWLFSH